MKKYLLFFLLTIFVVPCLHSQDKSRAKMMEELQQFKIDFLTKEMQLSEKEKAEFVPLYKEYVEQRRKAGAEAWKFDSELKQKKDASEADYKKLTELQQKAREKDNEITKQFNARLESFLTAKQIYLMHQGEGEFFEKMKEMRKKHRDGKHSHAKPDSKNHDKKGKKENPAPCEKCTPISFQD